jgi:hypothetical protein
MLEPAAGVILLCHVCTMSSLHGAEVVLPEWNRIYPRRDSLLRFEYPLAVWCDGELNDRAIERGRYAATRGWVTTISRSHVTLSYGTVGVSVPLSVRSS